jgi:hypothetical protein
MLSKQRLRTKHRDVSQAGRIQHQRATNLLFVTESLSVSASSINVVISLDLSTNIHIGLTLGRPARSTIKYGMGLVLFTVNKLTFCS